MASALLSVDALKVALGEETAEHDARYEQMIAQVQAIFEAECGRRNRPFAASVSARVEVHDGTGLPELLLDYPVRTLTSVLIGADPTDPDEALTVADRDVLRYGAGQARLVRVDGGVFGACGDPRVVQVTYATEDDLPEAARAAVLAGCKVLEARWGSEGVAAERVGAYSIDYANFVTADMANDPIWKLGVSACRDRLV